MEKHLTKIIVIVFMIFLLSFVVGCGEQSKAGSGPQSIPFKASDGASCWVISFDDKVVGANCQK